MLNLTEILQKASDTKACVLNRGAVAQLPEMFAQLFPGKKPIIIADENTWRVAGEKAQNALQAHGLNPEKPFIFTDNHLHAEWSFVEQLEEALKQTDAIAIAVGSGTINDLTKLVSSHLGRRYMTVGTAASMDGYTAYGASITYKGAKQTFNCPAPLGFIADIDIMATAPAAMTASGYADLFAKIPAGADWILADALGVEAIDPVSFNTVQGGLKTALADPEGLVKGDKDALGRLVEGLLLGGFAMQIHQTSRPASGADHQFSHLWNMENHTMADGTTPSHGFQVAIGTLASTAMYEQFLATNMRNLDIEACLKAWPTLEQARAEATAAFAATDFPTTGAKEVEAKYIDHAELEAQLKRLKANWQDIKYSLQQQIVPLAEVQKRLATAGAPIHPQQIGISPERLITSAKRAQMIRRRYTILDVALRTGNLDKWASALASL